MMILFSDITLYTVQYNSRVVFWKTYKDIEEGADGKTHSCETVKIKKPLNLSDLVNLDLWIFH